MLPKSYLRQVKKRMLSYQPIRRDVIAISGDALHAAKKAIFAFHRADMKEGETQLQAANERLLSLAKTYKNRPETQREGSYRAALEEFVEATVLHQFLTTQEIVPIKSLDIADEVYVAGLADVPGELYRYVLARATERDIAAVVTAYKLAQDIVEYLIECDLTKQLRAKFDQAKAALSKIERVQYELSLTKQ